MHLGITAIAPRLHSVTRRSRWVTGRIKDKIMGTAQDTASSTADAVNSAASDVAERAASGRLQGE